MPELDDDEPYAAPETVEDDRFKEMRKAANSAAKLRKENTAMAERLAQMERQIAVTQAGLSLNDKQQQALFAAHDGELTKDALLATAVELGFAQAPEPDETTQAREQALAGSARIAAATAGARPAAPAPKAAEQLATLEQAGDTAGVLRLKAALLAQQVLAGQVAPIT